MEYNFFSIKICHNNINTVVTGIQMDAGKCKSPLPAVQRSIFKFLSVQNQGIPFASNSPEAQGIHHLAIHRNLDIIKP